MVNRIPGPRKGKATWISRRRLGWYGQGASLRESERAWITHRDSECRYLTQQDVGTRGCLVEQINDRTEELREAERVLAAR